MTGADVIAFIEAAECEQQAKEIADKILDFGGSKPTEDEILARTRMVMEYVLHHALAKIESDLDRFEVEIQTCES